VNVPVTLSERALDALADALAERVAERVADRLPPAEPASPWMTAERAAAYLSVPTKRVRNLTARGAIPYYRHEGRVFYRTADLDQWMQSYRKGERQ
jgi:excisionase family DNA binding protein